MTFDEQLGSVPSHINAPYVPDFRERYAKHLGWISREVWGVRLDLRDADMRGANMQGANMRDADMRDADMRDADMRDADMRDADMRDADMRGADMRDADMRGADMRGANMRDVNMQGANMQGANMRDADMRDADMRDADMRGADMRDVNMQGANMQGANMRDAEMRGANMRDVNMRDVKHNDRVLRHAISIMGAYKYAVMVFIYLDGSVWVMMGCKFQSIGDWGRNWYNNDTEFPEGAPQTDQRMLAYRFAVDTAKLWISSNELIKKQKEQL